jgi:hypothetical protein
VRSAGKVISATPVTLAIALTSAGAAGYTWTKDSAVTQANPATVTGGTAPYSVTIKDATLANLPSNLTPSMSGGSVLIDGTPGSTKASTVYTITVTDAVLASVQTTFTVQINDASVTPLPRLYPFDLEAYGIDEAWVNGDPARTGGDGVVRFGQTTDPDGSGTSVYIARVKSGDPTFSYGGIRSEFVSRFDPANSSNATSNANSFLWKDHTYWMAFAIRLPTLSAPVGWPSGQSGDDRQLFFQVHAYNSQSPCFQLYYKGTSGTNSGKIFYDTVTSDALDGIAESQDTVGTPWIPPTGVWIKHIVQWRTSWPSGAILNVWRNEGSGYTQVVASTTPFGYRYTETGLGVDQTTFDQSDYPKFGIYKFGLTFNSYTDRYLHMYGPFKGEGTNLYAQAEAALAVL